MNSLIIRELEYFNILFDTQIDEEYFNHGNARIQLYCGEKEFVPSIKYFKEIGVFNYLSKNQIDKTRISLRSENWAREIHKRSRIYRRWFDLFLAKHARAQIQKSSAAPGGILDEVCRFILSRLPDDDSMCEDNKSREDLRLLWLSYINEASACAKANLSIGYAEIALKKINTWTNRKPDQNVYELLSLLNQGIGLAHEHRHEMSLWALDQVITTFDKRWPYSSDTSEYTCGRVPKAEKWLLLWKNYALIPALLAKAEVLSDLNRSTEQIELFRKYENVFQLSPYQTVRKDCLEVLAEIDRSFWELGRGRKPSIESAEQFVSKGYCESFRKKPALYQKCIQTEVTYRIRRLGKRFPFGELDNRTLAEIKNDIGQIDRLLEDYRKYAIRNSLQQQDEVKDALLLHVDFYSMLGKGMEQIGNSENTKKLQLFLKQSGFIDRTIKILQEISEKYFCANEKFPDQPSSVQRFLAATKIFAESFKDGKSRFENIERKTRESIIGNSTGSLSNWEQAQYRRRLQELGENECESKYQIPDNISQPIAEASYRVFCRSKCRLNKDRTCASTSRNECSVELGQCRALNYQRVLERNCDWFDERLRQTTPPVPIARNRYYLTVLKRWQSFTPALSTGIDLQSKGGGYFVYRVGNEGQIQTGIAVDPGFDFLENFLREGFCIKDIHAVMMTHAHLDHTVDFETLLTLIHEANDDVKPTPLQQLLVIMTSGSFRKYQDAISRQRELIKDVVVVEAGKEYLDLPGIGKDFSIHVTEALHNDLTGVDSVGYEFKTENGQKLLGFTGDTQWWQSLAFGHKDVPVLCANLGGIIKADKCYDENGVARLGVITELFSGDISNEETLFKMINKENHLYWPGLSLLLHELTDKTSLVVLSELPEEMKGGLKVDLARRMTKQLGANGRVFLPEDIGLTIQLSGDADNFIGIRCIACSRIVAPAAIIPIPFGEEETTHYVCMGCWGIRKQASEVAIINHYKKGKCWSEYD